MILYGIEEQDLLDSTSEIVIHRKFFKTKERAEEYLNKLKKDSDEYIKFYITEFHTEE